MFPDGTVKNGVFWLNGSSWIIENPSIPLNDSLSVQLVELQAYISRLSKRADEMENWLKENK